MHLPRRKTDHLDGSPFDAWLRTLLALGARILATVAASQKFTGSCAQWESWADLRMPVTGSYVVRNALDLLHLDRDADQGTLTEPGVWVQHC